MPDARFLGPHGSPRLLIRLPETESQQIPGIQELSRQALRATTRAETAEYIRGEMKKYAEVVKFSGAKID
jgi:hypothetical protein